MKLSFFLAALGLTSAGFAGTVITTGLPSGDAIINISGTEDGASEYSSNQSLWYKPFTQSGGPLLEYTFQPGTYSFRIIDPADASSLFNLSPSQLSQVYTGWTYNTPWIEDYLAFDSSAASNPSENQLFTGAVTPSSSFPGFADAQSAYDAAVSGGYYNQIVSGPNGRYGGTVSTSYTFTSTETLIFTVPDWDLTDNAGGVSVLISKANRVSSAPEPSTGLLIALGAGFVALARLIRGRTAVIAA